MNENIAGQAEKLVRKAYGLNDSYQVHTFSVKPATVDMELGNGIMKLKVSFPRDLVEVDTYSE